MAPSLPRRPRRWAATVTAAIIVLALGAVVPALIASSAGRAAAAPIVAVLDTGVDYTHPALAHQIWLNAEEIPPALRADLTDANGNGRLDFADLDATHAVPDANANGRIDAGDLLGAPGRAAGWIDDADTDGNGYVDDLIGWDFADGDNDPRDTLFHGTHVAGSILTAAHARLSDSAAFPRLMPLRINTADLHTAAAALRYAVRNGAGISNHSYAVPLVQDPRIPGAGPDAAAALDDLDRAVRAAAAANHLLVVAAGNGLVVPSDPFAADTIGDDLDRYPLYPASLPHANVVVVAAADRTGRLASFSNFGAQTVRVAAPGIAIPSTTPAATTPEMQRLGVDPITAALNGTSVAAPQVAGALAAFAGAGVPSHGLVAALRAAVIPRPGLAGVTAWGAVLPS